MRGLAVAWVLSAAAMASADEPPRSTFVEWPRAAPAPSPPPVFVPPPAMAPPPPMVPPPRMVPPPVAAPSPSPRPGVQLFGQSGYSGLRDVEVPKGQSIDTVQVPGVVTRPGAGLGEPITEIKIIDNTKTDPVTVEYLSGVKIGQLLTEDLMQQARTKLYNSELFKEVNVYSEAGERGARLVISAKDKISWVIAPTISYSDRNYGGGLLFAHGNLFGQNKKFLAFGEYSTAEKLLFVALLDPHVRHTLFYYRVDALLRRDTIVEYAAGHLGSPRLERKTDLDTFGAAALAGLSFTRRWHWDVRLKIYYDRVNTPTCYNTTNSDASGTPDVVAWQGGVCRAPSPSSWDNTLTTTFGYDGRSKVYGVLDGFMFNLTYQYGASWLGTKNDYHLLDLQAMYALKFNLGKWTDHNLLIKLGGDVDFDAPFKMEVEAGGALMRGYLYRQFRGDTSVRLTAEYIFPLFSISGLMLRGIAFYDSNLTWFRDLPAQSSPLARVVVRGDSYRAFLPDTPSGVVRDSWNNGLGGGLRMYLKGVVLPLIGVDFAYGIESDSFQFYLAVGSTLD